MPEIKILNQQESLNFRTDYGMIILKNNNGSIFMMKLLGAVLIAVVCLSGCSAAPNMVDQANAASLEFNGAAKAAEAEYAMEAKVSESAYDAVLPQSDLQVESAETTVGGKVAYSTITAASGQLPLVYTVFVQTAGEKKADDGTSLFISQCYTASISTGDSKTDDWLQLQIEEIVSETELSLQQIQDCALEDYKMLQADSDASEREFYTYSYYSNVTTARQDMEIVSLLLVNSTYCGGAHPNYTQSAYNYDLTRKTQLSLADVLYSDAADLLLSQLLHQLGERLSSLEGYGLFPEYQETVTAYFSAPNLTPYWYFSDNGLVIYFNCYDIAPYAAGIIKVEFPYDTLDGILLPEYFPESRADEMGSLELLSGAGARTVLEATPDVQSGTQIYLGTTGTVYDVRLYLLSSWITEETPIVGQMLFSANRLTAAEALLLNDSSEKVVPEYLITYRAADGVSYSYSVSSDGLSKVTLLNNN